MRATCCAEADRKELPGRCWACLGVLYSSCVNETAVQRLAEEFQISNNVKFAIWWEVSGKVGGDIAARHERTRNRLARWAI